MSWNDWNNELFKSAENGNLEQVKQCLENGADVNAKSATGLTALLVASKEGHFEVAKLLIENGAQVGIKDNNFKTALDLVKTGEIRELLRNAKDAEVNIKKKRLEEILSTNRMVLNLLGE